jgi:1,4-dihydroxy-2-naphthoate octaprenyltransferase
VVRFGRAFGVAEYGVLLAMAYAVPIGMVLLARASVWALSPLASLPLAASLLRTLARTEHGPALNLCLAATARLLLVHGGLLAFGLAQG